MLDKVEKFIFTLVLISVIGATTVVVKTIMECMESVAWKKEKINVNTLNFIKDFEKIHLHSYKCSGGKWSIGLEKVYNDILNRIDKEWYKW